MPAVSPAVLGVETGRVSGGFSWCDEQVAEGLEVPATDDC
jgi:hypothetical protein